MSFNIFGAADKNSIKVGYVDPERGYVTGVSRLEANKYAALNPGTRFIVTNRERTRFLNINEVNALEPADLIPKNNPSNADGCRRVDGLRPGEVDPNDLPVRLVFTGGSGIGAVGNPIFGRDGGWNGTERLQARACAPLCSPRIGHRGGMATGHEGASTQQLNAHSHRGLGKH